MKNKIKKMFPKLYSDYLFYKYKRMDQKKLAYYSSIPEEKYPEELIKMYKEKMGLDLNLENPERFSEKIQWRKVNDITPETSTLSDKYSVREWVSETIGEEYLIPLIGVWDDFDSIDFDSMPNSFVLKTNNASGTNIVVLDKSKMDKKRAKRQFDYWLKTPFWLLSGLELQYRDIKPKIIAEQYMVISGKKDLPDYKFYCFDGKVFCVYTRTDFSNGQYNGRVGHFDRDYHKLNVYREENEPLRDEELDKPENYELMVTLAEKLAQGFSHVRVDLYNLDGTIYFGEMTFTTHSGYCKYVPDEFDYILGEQWKLPIKKQEDK